MFEECPSLTNLNLKNFNCKNVTNMVEIFNGTNRECNIICNDEKINQEFKLLKNDIY
jgi:surface protein